MRTILGIDKSLQNIRRKLANNGSKLTDIARHMK